jgi:hypothetical protein
VNHLRRAKDCLKRLVASKEFEDLPSYIAHLQAERDEQETKVLKMGEQLNAMKDEYAGM